VQWQLDPAANPAKLPPLLLQPLVENAVRHGVEPCTQGGNIVISTQRDNSKVVVVISNSLPTMTTSATTSQTTSQTTLATLSSTAGQGIALNNVRDRLNLLHDIESSFQAGVKNGNYVVRMEFPA
jgi:two-component system sensor histidine kinase AlgZ